MFRTAILTLVAVTLQATPLPLNAQSTCAAKVEYFGNEKPILTLSKRYRDVVIKAVLPDLEAQANASGYDAQDLRPTSLSRSLHYWQVPMSSRDEHLWVVRFNTPQACGPHDGCATYIVSSTSKGIRNVVRGSDGASAGGAAGIAILPTANAARPELLFLSHLSAYETAVSCFRWTHSEYHSVSCTPVCAHFLDTPRPQ